MLSCMKAVFTFNAMQSRKRRRRAPIAWTLENGLIRTALRSVYGLTLSPQNTNSDFIAAFGFSGFDPTPSHSTL